MLIDGSQQSTPPILFNKGMTSMARKSKAAIWQEELARVSSCPSDLFEAVEYSEKTINSVRLAEEGDERYIKEITKELYLYYLSTGIVTDALIYFAKSGLAKSETYYAKILTEIIIKTTKGYKEADRVIEVISASDAKEVAKYKPQLYTVKAIEIFCLIENGENPELILSKLGFLPENCFSGEWLYVYLKLCPSVPGLLEKARKLASDIGVKPLPELPHLSLSEIKTEFSKEDAREAITVLQFLLSKYRHPEWQDFFIRSLYELASEYLDSDYTLFAKNVISVCESRIYDKKRNLHALAWCKYLLESTGTHENKEYEEITKSFDALYERCISDGIFPDIQDREALSSLMKNAVYTSFARSKLIAEKEQRLGFIIEHKKNRFILECELSNHTKRGRKHLWEATISIPTGEEIKAPPVFHTSTVERFSNNIQRGGITLGAEKKKSQIQSTSVMTVGGVKHPIFYDIILDISYVSLCKCDFFDIKIKSFTINEGHLTMKCQFLLD